MSIKTPRLIRDRCGVFYFRFIVPLSWRPAVGKTELRRSLRTKDAATARHAALLLSAQMEAIVATFKSTGTSKEARERDLLEWINDNSAYKMVVRVYGNGDAVVETDTEEEAKQARAIVADLAKAGEGVAAAAAQASAILPASRCGTALEQAQADYLAERAATLSKNTMPKLRGVLKSFIGFAGNLDVAMARPALIKDYKKKLLAEKKAPTTINDHIVALTGFFDYCIDNKIASMDNPARGLLIPGAHNKAESYEVFTDEELGRIFEPKAYLRRMKLPDLYWGPLIALHTGARAEEVASLKAAQIRQERGVWIIDILKGKTANAVRRVPLHRNLIELGLLGYRDAVAAAGHEMLFPHLIDGKNGYKKNMGRAFAEHLDSPEVGVSHELKVFHSFRHTVVTQLTDKGVNEGQKRALVGHDIGSRTSAHDDYIHASALTLPNLQIAINRLEYPSVDVTGLRQDHAGMLAAAERRIGLRQKRVGDAAG